MKNNKYYTVGIVPKIVERGKIDNLKHKYMTIPLTHKYMTIPEQHEPH
jgi:hypothetical protein